MKTSEAAALIRAEPLRGTKAQVWFDLGCGSGTFTLALAELLPAGSRIYAVDKSKGALRRIADEHNGVRVHKIAAEFVTDELPLAECDGVLMANSLHFVKEPEEFLRRVRKIAGHLLIVEYERRRRSMWVPYPVSFAELERLVLNAGYAAVRGLATRRSRFGGEMYSALARK